MKEKLGVDVGGVIIDAVRNDNTDTSFLSDNYLTTTAVPDAFNSLRHLVGSRFHENVFVVSKCGPVVEDKTRRWFTHHHFHERTGILEGHIRFCRKRPDKEPICKSIGITHFVDDRIDVLLYLSGTVPHLYLFNPEPQAIEYAHQRGIIPVTGWKEVLSALANTKETVEAR